MRITRRQTPQTIDPATLKPGATFYDAHVWAGDTRARVFQHHVLAVGKTIKHAGDGLSSFSLSEAGAIVRHYDSTPAGALATLRARLTAEAAEVAAEIAIIDATTPTSPAPEPIDADPDDLMTVISADGIGRGVLRGNTIHMIETPADFDAPHANSDHEPDDITGKR